jgi:hypothetical protein
MASEPTPAPYNPYNRQAPSTNGGKGYAIAEFDKFQTARNDPKFDDLEDIHVEGDNLEHIVGGFGDHLRLNSILQNILLVLWQPNIIQVCGDLRILEYSRKYYIILYGDSSKCINIKIISGIIHNYNTEKLVTKYYL